MLNEPVNDPLKNHPHCQNCGNALWTGDTYCADCGQRVGQGPPTFRQLFSEFFETVFNLDNRLFRTLRTLVIPGKLTTEYSAGRRKPYLGPLRFFFFTTVLFLASLSFLLNRFYAEDLKHELINKNRQGFYTKYSNEIKSALDTLSADPKYDTSCQAVFTDISEVILYESNFTHSSGYLSYEGGFSFTGQTIQIPVEDFATLTPGEIMDKHGVEGWFERFQIAQILRTQNMDGNGVALLIGQSVWGILLIIPLCALLLKLLYIRRKHLYIEHFVFALHVHTFIFLLLVICTLFLAFTEKPGLYWAMFIVPIYYLFALKRNYGQSWGKTLLKSFFLFIGYQTIVAISLAATLVVAIALF